jgi:nucleotide-binding universal stress UspA family protein
MAEAEYVDLIVMATHGRTGLSHLMVGSVGSAWFRTAPAR